MKTADKIALGVLIIAAISLITGGIVWAWSQRPIVDYQMTGNQGVSLPTSWAFGFSDSFPMQVSLAFDNRGSIDAYLYLIVSVTNAKISLSSGSPYNDTYASIYVIAQAHTGWDYQTVNITPVGNPRSFTVTYTIQTVQGSIFSIDGFITHIAYDIVHYGYTTVTYTNAPSGSYTYQLVNH